jgi:hypothetical protein
MLAPGSSHPRVHKIHHLRIYVGAIRQAQRRRHVPKMLANGPTEVRGLGSPDDGGQARIPGRDDKVLGAQLTLEPDPHRDEEQIVGPRGSDGLFLEKSPQLHRFHRDCLSVPRQLPGCCLVPPGRPDLSTCPKDSTRLESAQD